MRHRLLVVSAVALLVLTGCAPAPAPTPTPSASKAPTPTPTPTVEPIAAPTPAFDVTCADAAAEMTAIVGAIEGGVVEGLSLWSSPNWYPGPPQRMFERSGGVACSAGSGNHSWDVMIAPGGRAIVEGAAERGANESEGIRCEPGDGGDDGGSCWFTVEDDDILIHGVVNGLQLAAADTGKVEAAVQRLLEMAARTQREVVLGDSEIVGVPCTRFLTVEEASALTGVDVRLSERFGGWGIPAEVYYVVNGSEVCSYTSGTSLENEIQHLTITALPGGAWAFEEIQDATAVDIEGADAALTSVDMYGRSVLDLRIGPDWIRLVKTESSAVGDLASVATGIVKNFTVGHPAPR